VAVGICVSVVAEGMEEESPIEERTDGKPLADFITSVWLYEDLEKLRSWGLPPWAVQLLRKVDSSAYGEDDEPEPDVWQDPKMLAAALRTLAAWRVALRGNRSLTAQLDDHHFETDEFYEAQIWGLEDAVAICEWATKNGKRVKLMAW